MAHCNAVLKLDGWRFFFSSRRRHTRFDCDWSSDVCSSDQAERLAADLGAEQLGRAPPGPGAGAHVRSEERRVGEKWRKRGAGCYLKKKTIERVTGRRRITHAADKSTRASYGSDVTALISAS